MAEFNVSTPLGSELVVHEAPQHLGTGVVVHLRMNHIFDHRHVEIYLDDAALDAVIEALEHFQAI